MLESQSVALIYNGVIRFLGGENQREILFFISSYKISVLCRLLSPVLEVAGLQTEQEASVLFTSCLSTTLLH